MASLRVDGLIPPSGGFLFNPANLVIGSASWLGGTHDLSTALPHSASPRVLSIRVRAPLEADLIGISGVRVNVPATAYSAEVIEEINWLTNGEVTVAFSADSEAFFVQVPFQLELRVVDVEAVPYYTDRIAFIVGVEDSVGGGEHSLNATQPYEYAEASTTLRSWQASPLGMSGFRPSPLGV